MSSIAWPRSSAAERRAPPAWALAAVLAAAYLAVVPGGGDLASQAYRAHLGPVLWDNGWYGGHQMPGYSVLFPALGAVLGARLTGALAAVAAAALFERLALERWGERARLGTLWFALATAANLVSGRMTFALGLALALGAVYAATRGRGGTAVALGLLTSAASPVAAAFLALAAAASWLVERRPAALAVGAGALAPAGVLALAFPEGGRFPFAASSFWPALAALAGLLLAIPRAERVLRVGAALTLLVTIACFLVDNPLGGNVIRLATMLAGPLVACLLWRRRPWALALMAMPLLLWQWVSPVTDWARAAGDPSVHEAYHAPLNAFLDRQAGGPFRVEIPFTAAHWEARWVASSHPLARGWLRQLDTVRNPLFYDGRPLTAARYRRWLDDNAVRFVAVPDAPLDASARAEAALVRRGAVPGLRPVWRERHWRVYEVAGARPLAAGAARAVALDAERLTLRADRAGAVDVRVRFNPYWRLTGGRGCVQRAPGGWTRVRLAGPGTVRLEPSFAPARVGATGPRCAR
ncbi:MAG: hypothetical protein QOD81_1629 [Solirubrobacteraceae bacterium]|jgi:hypothetical protein|nr:hypothetical protein [Solirubrobacteraceae bacterium]